VAIAPRAHEVHLEPIEATRTFETAIEHIVDAIEGARLRTGDRLPNEGELAAMLHISKPTLRQALRVLERAGLVGVRRGVAGGIFVTADLVPVELIGDFVALEEDKVVDVLVARRLIETDVSHMAALRAGDDDFAEIERTVALLEAHLGDRPIVMRADAAFHRAVARACHNRALQASMRLLARDIAPIRDAYRGGEQIDAITVEVHRRQLRAMRRGGRRALDAVLDAHFRMLEQDFAEGIGRTWDELFGVYTVVKPPRRSR
jgi:GntR family transcriptional repressor for pyruvate dehydrogenase complex